MSEESDVQTETLDNWKPGEEQKNDCSGIDCTQDDEHDCCSCCW